MKKPESGIQLRWVAAGFAVAVSCPAQNVANVVKQGEAVFSKTCATGYCHGIRGGPSGAPRLAARGFDQAYISKVVTQGVPDTGMASFSTRLSPPDLEAVIAYVATLNGIANPDVSMDDAGDAVSTRPTLIGEAARGARLLAEAVRGFGRCSVAGSGLGSPRGWHLAGAELARHFFPLLRVVADVRSVQAVEHQAGRFQPPVVARDAVLVNDGTRRYWRWRRNCDWSHLRAGRRAGILGLDDFRPRPHDYTMRPLYTDALGKHSLAPDDFATIYDLNPLYSSGFDGTGQRIVVIGQSDVALSDIQLFRSTYGLPPNDPQMIPVSGGFIGVNSSEIEADLDLEWAGAVARNATILYVASGNALTGGVPYAIDQNLAPIITYSFAGCEQHYSTATRTSTQEYAQQANAQGITWLAGSGDSGAAGCDSFGNPNHLAATQGLAVSFPVSLPEVTGVGGTQFSEGAGTYWSTSNSNNLASALSYIPETSWNELGVSGLLASGGGLSVEYARPPWQIGPGLPGWNGRAVPDLSLAAGGAEGYRIVHGGISGVVGGTSAGTPSFAGILALANQYQIANGVQTQSDQGNINPSLYRLAQTTSNVFHDITTGGNIVACVAGTPDCSIGVLGYPVNQGGASEELQRATDIGWKIAA